MGGFNFCTIFAESLNKGLLTSIKDEQEMVMQIYRRIQYLATASIYKH